MAKIFCLCHKIKPEYTYKLVIKVIHGNILVQIQYSCIKYFSLTVNSVMRNTAPFFSLSFAYIFL